MIDRICSLEDKFLGLCGVRWCLFKYQKAVSLLLNVQLTNKHDLFDSWVPDLIYLIRISI